MRTHAVCGLILLFTVSGAFCQSWNGQQLYFRHLNVEDGLAQNTVWCIMQDKTGFMWFGTKDGLNRYDGNRFKTFCYDPLNPKTSLGNNFVRSLFEDDNGRIYVGTSIGMYVYDQATEQFRYFDNKTAGGVRITHEVNDIKADEKGNLWIAVFSQGVFRYDTKNDELTLFQHILDNPHSLSSNDVWSICIDMDDVVWVGSIAGGLDKFDASTDNFLHFPVREGNSQNDVYKIMEKDNKVLLLGTPDRGVLSFDRVSGLITPHFAGSSSSLFVREIKEVTPGQLWVGTESGLHIYDTETGAESVFTHITSDDYSLSSNSVYSIYKDREGGVWLGTYFGGVNYLPSQYDMFKKYYPTSTVNHIASSAIREFKEDKHGNLWIGTEDNGMFYFNTETEKAVPFSKVRFHNIHGILTDGDSLWVGYFTRGLDLVNLKTGKTTSLTSSDSPASLSDNNVFSIYRDSYKNIWIGTIYGLNFIEHGQQNIQRIKETGAKTFIYDIIEDRRGMMWFATWSDGVYCYNRRTGDWLNFRHKDDNPESLGSDKTIGLFEDSTGRIWVSTEGAGVSVFMPDLFSSLQKYGGSLSAGISNWRVFKTYNTTDGLPNNVVYKVLQDNDGNFWMSTNKGLARFDEKNERFTVFTHDQGLLSNQFNYKSGIKTKDGKLYFGTTNGFISFDPHDMKPNKVIPPVVLTGFRIFNNEIRSGENSPLHQSTVLTKKIELLHNQNSFGFDFAVLSYNAPKMNTFSCRLEGFDNDWRKLTGNGAVDYTNLPPGKYRFRAKGANSDGASNEEGVSIDVVIHPSFWSSVWGIILRWLLVGGTLLFIAVAFEKRLKARNRRKILSMEIETEKAIYKAKTDFFINIAHEIRTPLSLIKGPYEQISKKTLSLSDYEENIEIMGSNINRLLNLTNQLLDFSKAENCMFTLHLTPTDVGKVIENLLYRFKQVFTQNNLNVKTTLPEEPVISLVDDELLTKILSNLINNACKFADKNIIIELCLDTSDNQYYSIRISNDGKLILPENRENIFNAFFQERNEKFTTGTGLGLSLVKRLVDLHRGKVYIDEKVTGMNCFVVKLPLTSDKMEHEESKPVINEKKSAKSVVLIVDDDPEMCRFMKSVLSEYHAVFQASDGNDASDVLKKESVDLVVSDVMMPNMDGYELCAYIKNHIRYSHIPVILLTARDGIDSKIEGLGVGADAYIEKPFSTVFLIEQIKNLLNNRKLLKESFLNNPSTDSTSIATSKTDKEFLERINEVIIRNINNEKFSIDQLASELAMSRSSLHHKIKVISQLTPNDFIMIIRLKEAARLLKDTEYRMNEVCYMVGFSSPSYFAKCFYKQFGILPKDYHKKR